ncbi:MAG TPA: hypothetical protein VOA80_19540 [Thermoanaerobaculia bacterium]|nr:hypothetical protein [Thermoanaerobaculia bacterium]
MNVRKTVVGIVFAWSLGLAAVASAQTGAPAAGGPVATTSQAEAEAVGENLDFSKAPLIDAPNDPGSAFVARAIADRSWSVTLGNSSTLDGYTFPATLQVLPFLWSSTSIADADQAAGLMRLLLQSSVAVKYVPLVVRRTPGTKTGTDTSSDRKGSITYSLPLLGTARVQRYHDFIHAALDDVTLAARREGRHVTPEELAAAATKARDRAAQVAEEYSRFSLVGSAGFGWDTRQDKPNSFNAGLTGTKVLTPVSEIKKPSHYTWILNASAVEAWFQSVSVTPSFSRFSGSLGVDFQLPAGVMFSLVPNLDHYSDGGYAAILGFANTTRHDDVTLKEVVTLKIPGGNKVALSVSEEHLGTSDHDVAVNFGVSYKLPFPPDVGGGSQ